MSLLLSLLSCRIDEHVDFDTVCFCVNEAPLAALDESPTVAQFDIRVFRRELVYLALLVLVLAPNDVDLPADLKFGR